MIGGSGLKTVIVYRFEGFVDLDDLELHLFQFFFVFYSLWIWTIWNLISFRFVIVFWIWTIWTIEVIGGS